MIRVREFAGFGALVAAPILGFAALAWRSASDADAVAQRALALRIEESSQRLQQHWQQELALLNAQLTGPTPINGPTQFSDPAQSSDPSPSLRRLGAHWFSRADLERAASAAGTATPATTLAHCSKSYQQWIQLPTADRRPLTELLIKDCQDARRPDDPNGAFLWPIVALSRNASTTPDEVARWISAHQTDLNAAERVTLQADLDRLPALRQLKIGPESAAKLGPSAATATAFDPDLAWARRIWLSERSSADTSTVGGLGDATGAQKAPLRRSEGGRLVLFQPDRERPVGVVLERDDVQAVLRRQLSDPDLALNLDLSASPDAKSLTEPFWLRVTPVNPQLADRLAQRHRYTAGGLALLGSVALLGAAFILLRRLLEERRLSALRTDYVAALSHELRTPMASIQMLSELAAQGRVPPEELPEVVQTLAGQANRLTATLHRLSFFARMSAGKPLARRQNVDVAALLRATVTEFCHNHSLKPEAVRLHLSPDSTDAPLMWPVDTDQVTLAVDNLLRNALKHAPDGQPYELSLTTSPSDQLVIALRDHGAGIAPDALKRIFEPFERSNNRLSVATEGLGLGLALVKFVAQSHGGTVRAENGEASEAGNGARFVLTLPRGT